MHLSPRLSTIQNANQIIVLEEGQVIQQDDFKQLAHEDHKMFSNLLKKQQFEVV